MNHSGILQDDELFLTDPEPCEFCTGGIRWMYCYDDQWRCRDCVMRLAIEKGWDKVPPRPGEEPEVQEPTPGDRGEQLRFDG